MPYSYLTNHHLYSFDRLLAHLGVRPGQTVLDLGCGHHGYWTFPLSQIIGKTGQIHAIDIDRAVIKNIKRKSAELRLSQIKAVRADLEKLNQTDLPKADIGILVNTMFQLDNKRDLLKNLEKTLKPRAKVLVVDWRININPYGPPNERRIKEEDIEKWAKRAKLETLKELFLDDDHFAKILIKV